MIRVGLTGNAASGKSTVARNWAAAGVPVSSADELAREVVQPGSPALAEIRDLFGDEVIAPTGELDRSRMRALAFGNPDVRRRLEAIVHPRISELRETWLAKQRAEDAPLVVSEVPLLFETGMETKVDVIVLVDAPEEERLRRLVEDRGILPEQARQILGSQGDPATKRARAHHVLENHGSREDLLAESFRLLERLRGPFRMDLHLHTEGSWDCLSNPDQILVQARRRGVERIAITDHNHLGVASALAERYPGRVVPGEEVKTHEGVDVIGLYMVDEIPKGTPAKETCMRIREQGGIVYLPHPYARGKGGDGRMADALAPLADIVEVFNARLQSKARNRRAEALAERHGRLRGAGSDAHTVGEVGGAWVELPFHPNEPEAFLEALVGATVHGRRAGPHVFLASNWAKLVKRVTRA